MRQFVVEITCSAPDDVDPSVVAQAVDTFIDLGRDLFKDTSESEDESGEVRGEASELLGVEIGNPSVRMTHCGPPGESQ